jgi:HEAT repeat protein
LATLLYAPPLVCQSAVMAEDNGVVAVPAPWLQQDQGDSLYQAGRAALNRGDYRAATRQFRALRDRYPRSGYAGDAHYWEAFARSKLGSKEELRTAMDLLQVQAERYPDARTGRDARELRVRIQGELAQLGDAASAAAVAQAASPPTVTSQARGQSRQSCSEEDDERLIALNALLQMRAEQALPILRQVLERRDEGSVCLRRQAMFLVSQKRSPETAAILLEAARSDPDAEVRENAVFWLSQVDAPEATTALDSILRGATDPELQKKAVFALSQQRGEAAAAALRAHLERPGASDEIKEDIVFWLGQQRSTANAQYLKDFYATTTSEALKEKVLFSLSQMNLDENARWLIGVAQDESEPIEIRKNALFWAGQMKLVPFSDLAGMYASVQDREMKEQLIFVYSQRNEPEAVDQLLQIARTETDTELRKNAIFWLSQSDDPRVAEFLLEVINK